MTNPDSKQTNRFPSGSHYLEETVQGLSQQELDASAQTLVPSQQNLSQELAETSLRPQIMNDGFQLEAASVGERQILPVDGSVTDLKSVDYRAIELLGEGGMGQVHLAEQIALGRNVAVKQIRPSLQQSSDQKEFLTEAVVTGRLEHPNIVPIYEVGRTNQGNLFYSMKNVQGDVWSETIEKKNLLENLDTLLDVCDALAFAHSQGVIHRDLKPDNIMIGGFGEVLVLDWGLAIILGDPSASRAAIAGTPAYMAPEMVNTPEQANIRSDVYLLGGILYRILSGHSPHAGESARDSLMAASRNEIVVGPESRLANLDPSGELLEIALRAMKADPEVRFASVTELQTSIRDFLLHRDSLELSARAEKALKEAQDSGDYAQFSRAVFGYEEAVKLWEENLDAQSGTDSARLRWAEFAEQQGDYDLCLSLLDEVQVDHGDFKTRLKRAKSERDSRQGRLQRLKVIGLAASLLIAVAATGAAIWIDSERDKALTAQKLEAEQRERADSAASLAIKEATRADKEAEIAKAEAIRADAEALAARENLAEAERTAYGADMLLTQIAWKAANLPRVHQLLDRYQEREDLKGLEWNYFKRLTDASLDSFYFPHLATRDVAFSPDGRIVCTGRKDGRIAFRDTNTDRPFRKFKSHEGYVYSVCFSPDGKYHASSGVDGRIVIREYPSRKIVHKMQAHTKGTTCVRFSPDSSMLVSSGNDSLIKLWDRESGQELKILKGHDSYVNDVAFSPDGSQVLSGGDDGTVRLWNVRTGAKLRSFKGLSNAVNAVVFHPDGKLIAAGGDSNKVIVWDRESGEPAYSPYETALEVFAIALSPQGDVMAISDQADRIYIFDVDKGEEVNVLLGHKYSVKGLAFSPDGEKLASVSGDGLVKMWDVRSSPEQVTLLGHTGSIRNIVVSPDGKTLASVGDHGAILVRETESGQLIRRLIGHEGTVYGLDFSSDGRIISSGNDRSVRVWGTSGELIHHLTEHNEAVLDVCVTPDCRQLVSIDYSGVAKIWDLDTGAEIRSVQTDEKYGWRLQVTPDGKNFATGHLNGLICLWDMGSGTLVREFDGKDSAGDITALTISEDGRWIAGAGLDSTIRIYDFETGQVVRTLRGHNLSIWSLKFNTDASRLGSASMDGTVKIWNLDNGQEALTLDVKPHAFAIDFHPDDHRIYSGGTSGELQVWDTRIWTEELRTQARARSLLNGRREHAKSLEAFRSAIDTDQSLKEATKQQAREWAERFWNDFVLDLPRRAQVAVKDGELEEALGYAGFLRNIGQEMPHNYIAIAEIYTSCLPEAHVDDRPRISELEKQCLIDAFEISAYADIWPIPLSDRYNLFNYDADILQAKLECAKRQLDVEPDNPDAVLAVASTHYQNGVGHRKQGRYRDAIVSLEAAVPYYRQRVETLPNEYGRHSDLIVCLDRLAKTYTDACQYDLAIEKLQKGVDVCNFLMERDISPESAQKKRDILSSLLARRKDLRNAAGDWDHLLELTEKSPSMFYDRCVELSKAGRFEEAMQSAEKLLTFEHGNATNTYNSACAYSRCAELMLSPTEMSQKPSDPELPKTCIAFGIKCLQGAKALGFDDSIQIRNDPDLRSLHGRPEFREVIGLQASGDSEIIRTQWRTSQESIENSNQKNHSAFTKQPNGDWLESGVDLKGKTFATRFTLHRKTALFIELNKEGIDLRVRLWPDKAFWGRVSTELDTVSKWIFLQNGGWENVQPD